jgi:hypothetical protein
MRVVKRLFDFYINTSLHIGLAVLALTNITELILKIPSQINLHFVIFFGTVLGYNVLKHIDSVLHNVKWFLKNRAISLVSALSLITASYFFLQLLKSMQLAFLSIGIVIVLYPFLRRFGLLKMFLVSFCITTITVYVPKNTLPSCNIDFYLTLLQRFLIIVSLLVPFEIFDSKTDNPSMKTLPHQFGIQSTKIFGMLLVIPFLLLEFFKTNLSYSIFVVSMITVLFIHFSSVHKNKYYTSFWVESVPILWWILLLIRNF